MPNAKNSDATPPTLEGLEEEDLSLTSLKPQCNLRQVNINQDGTTGLYDIRVEVVGFLPHVVTIVYTNESEQVRRSMYG